MIAIIGRVVRASHRVRLEIGRDPTADELATDLLMPAAEVADALRIAKGLVALETSDGDVAASGLPGGLTPREEWVLQRRFDIDLDADPDAEETSRGLSETTLRRLREIEAQALGRLKDGDKT